MLTFLEMLTFISRRKNKCIFKAIKAQKNVSFSQKNPVVKKPHWKLLESIEFLNRNCHKADFITSSPK